MRSLEATTGLSFLLQELPEKLGLFYYQIALANLVELRLEVDSSPIESCDYGRCPWDSHGFHTMFPTSGENSMPNRQKGLLGKLLQETSLLETLDLRQYSQISFCSWLTHCSWTSCALIHRHSSVHETPWGFMNTHYDEYVGAEQ